MKALSDADLFATLAVEQEAGHPVVLATVIRKTGSVPRETGAKMLFWANGTTLGSVGGGCVEAEVQSHARDILLRTREPRRMTVSLTEQAQGGTGDVCGGQMEIYLDYIATEHGHVG